MVHISRYVCEVLSDEEHKRLCFEMCPSSMPHIWFVFAKYLCLSFGSFASENIEKTQGLKWKSDCIFYGRFHVLKQIEVLQYTVEDYFIQDQ